MVESNPGTMISKWQNNTQFLLKYLELQEWRGELIL
jgi:hypothetical protein